jgi:HSP20 family protein
MLALRNPANLFDVFRAIDNWPRWDVSPEVDWSPRVDVLRKENVLEVRADLPGIKREDIKVDLKNGTLSISGSVTRDSDSTNLLRSERFFGSFMRQFTVPEDIDPDAISAEYKDGVLVLQLPITAEKKTRQIKIN